MSDHLPMLPTYGATSLTRDDRLALRQLATIDRSKHLSLARLEAQAQVEAGRAHAVGYVGQQAMQAVAMVSQIRPSESVTGPKTFFCSFPTVAADVSRL